MKKIIPCGLLALVLSCSKPNQKEQDMDVISYSEATGRTESLIYPISMIIHGSSDVPSTDSFNIISFKKPKSLKFFIDGKETNLDASIFQIKDYYSIQPFIAEKFFNEIEGRYGFEFIVEFDGVSEKGKADLYFQKY